MRWSINLKQWCLKHLAWAKRALWVLSFMMLILALYSAWQWRTFADKNARIRESAMLVTEKGASPDDIWAYARGFASQALPEQALKLFYLPETSEYPRLRAYAKFAIGNLYFDWAMLQQDHAKGGAHQQQVAMIALAKEAYKDVLRIDPDFADARFNLELLDRRSPEKRTQGWQSETDGVTLKPFKRNGTAMMRDNERRGLP